MASVAFPTPARPEERLAGDPNAPPGKPPLEDEQVFGTPYEQVHRAAELRARKHAGRSYVVSGAKTRGRGRSSAKNAFAKTQTGRCGP